MMKKAVIPVKTGIQTDSRPRFHEGDSVSGAGRAALVRE